MPITINTNSAATSAAINLSRSNQLLNQSLNRLSSGSKIVNPSDDAGGLAVSMKMKAATHRQAQARTNVGNAISYLQTQDGALESASKILNRMSELKTLYGDQTKNATDLANYDREFSELQTQLSSLADETFNGISLFSSSSMSIGVGGENLENKVSLGGAELFGTTTTTSTSATTLLSDNFSDLSNWTDASTGNHTASASGGQLTLIGDAGPDDALVESNQTFSGAFEVTFNSQSPNNSEIELEMGGVSVFEYDFSDTNAHSFRVVFDGNGGTETYVDGSSTAFATTSGVPTSGKIGLLNDYFTTTYVSNFNATSETTTTTSTSNTSSVRDASGLANVSIDEIKGAIQDVATLRADNGAQQSRLQFADEMLTINMSNLEAANSRITDVDVAQESTALARANILVQAGASMLSQANQSSQIALRLLG
ncbi:flagellin [Pelagicoccus sp. SDUM812003]|uniref:flagellin n=1 Tax=Pelagicoccus sp. SDUM812003 TaxID=3041267 RepID=UPI00280D5765|nr:flagellin [Pelagicoccus sp. SDUM812003]MDQ8201796.1 flagellin [Pelagicoccus sp. SDUM812003]